MGPSGRHQGHPSIGQEGRGPAGPDCGVAQHGTQASFPTARGVGSTGRSPAPRIDAMNPISHASRYPARVTRRQLLSLAGTIGLTRVTTMNPKTPTQVPINKTRPAASELCFKDAVELARMIR